MLVRGMKSTFIEEVALRLYEKYGDEVSSLTLFMPSKRARLFFAEALSKVAIRALWEPEYASIDDLMCRLADLRKGDKLRLVAELYNVYSKYHNETFDKFYHWGEILIADFDMVDKYMIDSEQLFTNIYNLKELESDMSYLSAEQIEVINRFWRTFAGDNGEVIDGSVAKKKFLAVWRSLGDIYKEFRARLKELKIGYTGMIYREAVERLERGEAEISNDAKRYAFIGFNALSKCESTLLRYMKEHCNAEFFWDYDDYYVDDSVQEAGMFIRENLRLLSEESGISHKNFGTVSSAEVISTSSGVLQCQYVVKILEEIAAANNGILDKDTAVVLTDENMLMPLLYALPEHFKVRNEEQNGKRVSVPAINVTMGYPLRNTLAYSFVERLLELQKHARTEKSGEVTFYHVDVEGILTHPYIANATSQYAKLRDEIVAHRMFRVPQSMLSTEPLLIQLFEVATGWRALSGYLLAVVDKVASMDFEGEDGALRSEFLAVISESLSKLANIVDGCGLDISDTIYRSLVRRHLQAERVPFTGEPLQGLQIMGILETRNLDFKNVIILSMTDNNFPGNRVSDKSFIPYGIRYGFGLPTAEHHEGVYAYYFYRLIERAERLYMLYSSATDDKSTGEPSRYIKQLEYETSIPMKQLNVGVDVSLSPETCIEVEKSSDVFEKLLRFTRDKSLSPTAFSTYVKCPLKFYFNVVERLRPEDELEESVDNMTFGNIFHEAADRLYSKIKGMASPAQRLAELRDNGEVERCVDEALAAVYFKREGEPLPELGGELLIIRNIVKEYLGANLLNYDIRNSDFVVDTTEGDVDMVVAIDANGEHYDINLAGRADRIDSLDNGMLRVIDYKTGKPKLGYGGVDALFTGTPVSTKRESNIINTLLYSMMLSHTRKRDVRPELYYVGSMVQPNYSPLFVETIERKSRKLEAYSECSEEFERMVRRTLMEMFDKSIPFEQCEDNTPCRYCDYNDICKR